MARAGLVTRVWSTLLVEYSQIGTNSALYQQSHSHYVRIGRLVLEYFADKHVGSSVDESWGK